MVDNKRAASGKLLANLLRRRLKLLVNLLFFGCKTVCVVLSPTYHAGLRGIRGV